MHGARHATNGDEARANRRAEAPGRRPDFKVVFWFDGHAFRYQAYDVRKGQYTKAVQDWVEHEDIDAYGYVRIGRLATVRDVYLDAEQGRTEQEKLASAIAQHLAKIERFDVSRLDWGLRSRPLPSVTPVWRFQSRGVKTPSRVRFDPPAPLMPQPYPYPRPHL